MLKLFKLCRDRRFHQHRIQRGWQASEATGKRHKLEIRLKSNHWKCSLAKVHPSGNQLPLSLPDLSSWNRQTCSVPQRVPGRRPLLPDLSGQLEKASITFARHRGVIEVQLKQHGVLHSKNKVMLLWCDKCAGCHFKSGPPRRECNLYLPYWYYRGRSSIRMDPLNEDRGFTTKGDMSLQRNLLERLNTLVPGPRGQFKAFYEFIRDFIKKYGTLKTRRRPWTRMLMPSESETTSSVKHRHCHLPLAIDGLHKIIQRCGPELGKSMLL